MDFYKFPFNKHVSLKAISLSTFNKPFKAGAIFQECKYQGSANAIPTDNSTDWYYPLLPIFHKKKTDSGGKYQSVKLSVSIALA